MEMQKKLVSKASKWKIIVLSRLWKTKRVTFVKTGKIQGTKIFCCEPYILSPIGPTGDQ